MLRRLQSAADKSRSSELLLFLFERFGKARQKHDELGPGEQQLSLVDVAVYLARSRTDLALDRSLAPI